VSTPTVSQYTKEGEEFQYNVKGRQGSISVTKEGGSENPPPEEWKHSSLKTEVNKLNQGEDNVGGREEHFPKFLKRKPWGLQIETIK